MATKTYTKGQTVRLSGSFVSTEFDCKGKGCCHITKIDDKLVAVLQNIRNHFNSPITINSAYRCAAHNKSVGGASISKHIYGYAADIVVKGILPEEVAKYAESIGVLGIGLYPNFTHVDTRINKFFWKTAKQIPVATFGGTAKQKTEIKTEEEIMYHLLKEVPGDYRPELDKIIAEGYFKGKGGSGENLIVDLSESDIRVMLVNYRMINGKLDKLKITRG